MITNWQYINIPDGIDLEQPLMPLRADDDNGIYGIDPAWLYEVLTWWDVGGSSVDKVDLPPRPSAEFMDLLFFRMTGIKDTPYRFYSAVPQNPFDNIANIPTGVAFGDIPASPSVGDPVRKTDISDIYDWIKDIKYELRQPNPNMPTLSYTTQSGHEGYYDGHVPTPPAGAMLNWNWGYSDFTGSAYEWMTGGWWCRQTAASFDVTATISGSPGRYDSVSAFMSFSWIREEGQSGNPSEVDTGALYIPLSNCALNGSTLTAHCDVPAIIETLGVTEPPYTPGPYASPPVAKTGRLLITGGSSLVCFCKLDADYRYPVA